MWDCGFLEFGVCPIVGEACLEVRGDLLCGRVRALGILEFMSAQWHIELCPGLSGEQGHVYKRLWAQEVLRQVVF